jgi:hypothetical protein
VGCSFVLYALLFRGCRVFCVSRSRVRCRTHDFLAAAQDTTDLAGAVHGPAEAPDTRCSGVIVVLHCCYSGVTVVLQWCYIYDTRM